MTHDLEQRFVMRRHVDSAGLIHETMRRTFDKFGRPEPRCEDTKAIIGLSLDIAIARMQGRQHVEQQDI
ncbi:hypothetical protein ACC689_35215, partial [Rhizobium ruizarguesonis]